MHWYNLDFPSWLKGQTHGLWSCFAFKTLAKGVVVEFCSFKYKLNLIRFQILNLNKEILVKQQTMQKGSTSEGFGNESLFAITTYNNFYS